MSLNMRLYSFSSGCGLRGQPPVVAIELKLTARKPQSQWESSGRRMRKDLGQSPIQSAHILTACCYDNAYLTTIFLCINITLAFSVPSKIKIFGKYCMIMPGL